MMALHPDILHHLQRLSISVPADFEGSAVEILSEQISWPRRSYDASFERRREIIVAQGTAEAAEWNEDQLLDHSFGQGPRRCVGLRIGQAVLLDFYSGVDNDTLTWWSECSSHLYFLQENDSDPSNPYVAILDSEETDEAPYGNGTVVDLLAILEHDPDEDEHPGLAELLAEAEAAAKPVMPEPLAPSEADLAWVAESERGAKKVLNQILSSRHVEISLMRKGLSSLPPAILVEGGWRMLRLDENPGLDPLLVSQLDRVEILTLSECEFTSFDIVLPPGLKRLSLEDNNLTTWPAGLGAGCDELVYISLQSNQLTAIPEQIGELTTLDTCDFGYNAVVEISAAIGRLTRLIRLDLAGNRVLATLPPEILDLPGNCAISLNMTALPDTLQRVRTVSELREAWGDLTD